jgi:hypothetical protein
MNLPRAVSVTLAVAAAAMLATGSLGFSSVSAERGVQVNVVDAEEAYVGVVACEKPSSNNQGEGANPVRVWVTNQYSGQFTVTAVTSDTGYSVTGQVPEQLAPGDSERFESLNADSEVTVTVTGGLDAVVTVDVYSTATCPRSVSKGSDNSGEGNGTGTSSNGSGSTTQAPTATTTTTTETTTTAS